MPTQIKKGKEARQLLQEGVNEVADTVKLTLGAGGKNVFIPNNRNGYDITKDGVSIARQIEPVDPYVKLGAAAIKEAAEKTNKEAGDSTTTTAVLAQAIFNGGVELLDQGHKASVLKAEIDSYVKEVVAELDALAIPVTPENLVNIATISANGDKELGELIASAFNKIGENGVVLSAVSDTPETYYEHTEGIQLDQGTTSPLFYTDLVREECVFENPLVLLHKGKLSDRNGLITTIEAVMGQNKKLLIITDDIEPTIASLIIQNIKNGSLLHKVCLVKSPQILKIQKNMLDDIATLTGATIVSDLANTKIQVRNLGRLEKCVIKETSSILVGDNKNLQDTIEILNQQISETKDLIEKNDLRERLSRITGNVVTIHIGATSDSELKEKADRVEDAINATRSALEEGIIEGGGVTLARICEEELMHTDTENPKDIIKNMFYSCLREPLLQITKNAELMPINIPEIMRGRGLNAKTGEYVNMVNAGIIDPKKAIRCALENAAYITGLFLTTEAIVIKK
jgi:chaperonin GroEL